MKGGAKSTIFPVRVRDQMSQASTEIIQLLITAKDLGNAKFFRQLTLSRYGNLIPESSLPPEPEVKPKLTFRGRLLKALRGVLPWDSSQDTGKK